MIPAIAIRLIREALLRATPLSAAEQDALSTVEDLILRPRPVDLQPLTSAADAAVDAATLVAERIEELRDSLDPTDPPAPTLMQRVRGWFGG